MDPVDPQHRVVTKQQLVRLALLFMGVVAAAGVLVILAVRNYMSAIFELAQSDPVMAGEHASTALFVTLVCTAVVAAAVGAYVVWYGYRAVRAGCHPPPRAWVLEGRPVYTGGKARRIGKIQMVLGVAMAAATFATVYFASRIMV